MGVERDYEPTPVADLAPPVPAVDAQAPAAPVPVGIGTLVVGHAEDRAEADADQRADTALGRLRRLTGDAGTDAHAHGPGCDHVRRIAAPGAAPVVGREGGALDPGTSSAIESRRGSGRPLDAGVRRRMETAFATDLGGVRIHDDPASAALNSAVSARAFTTGKDIFFGAGQYAPDTPGGERVLAHELAHTLQPSSGPVQRTSESAAAQPAAAQPAGAQPAAAPEKKKSLGSRFMSFVFGDKEEKQKKNEVTTAGQAKEGERDEVQAQERKAGEEYRARRALEFAAEEEAARRVAAQLAGQGNKDYTFRSPSHRRLMEQLNFANVNYHSQMDEYRAKDKAKAGITDPKTVGKISDAECDAAYRYAYIEQKWQDSIDLDLLMFRPLFSSKDERLASHIKTERTKQGAAASVAEANRQKAAPQGKLLEPEVEAVYDTAARKIVQTKTKIANDDSAKLVAITMAFAAAGKDIQAKRPKDSRIENAAFAQALERVAAAAGPMPAAKSGLAEAQEYAEIPDKVAKPAGTAASLVSKGLDAGGDKAASDAVDDFTGLLKDLLKSIKTVLRGAEAITVANEKTTTENVLKATKATSDSAATLLSISENATKVAATFSAADVAASLAAKVVPGVSVAKAVMTLVGGVFTLREANGNRDTSQQSLFDVRLKTHGTKDIDTLVNPLKYMTMMLTKKYEQAIWGVGSAIKDIVCSSLELAGGFTGIPTAAKAALAVVDGMHSLGHFVHNQVLAWQSETARGAAIEALEGSAEQQMRHDPAMVMDVIITRAQDASEPAAMAMLQRYVTAEEIASQPMTVLRKKVLDLMEVSENPQTVYTTMKKVVGSAGTVLFGPSEESWLARRTREQKQLAADRTLMDGKERGYLWHFQMAFKRDSFERSKAQTAVKMRVACAVGPLVVGYDATPKELGAFAEKVKDAPLHQLMEAEKNKDTLPEWKQFLQGVIQERMAKALLSHKNTPLPKPPLPPRPKKPAA